MRLKRIALSTRYILAIASPPAACFVSVEAVQLTMVFSYS
jgi:hypothetical protein